jgi:hypothetical protein
MWSHPGRCTAAAGRHVWARLLLLLLLLLLLQDLCLCLQHLLL